MLFSTRVNARPVLGVAAVLVAGWASPAAAAGAPESGWWTSSPVPHTADAESTLVIQGSPQADQPLAFAAVVFPLDAGEVPARLTVTLASSGVSTPGAGLLACPVA